MRSVRCIAVMALSIVLALSSVQAEQVSLRPPSEKPAEPEILRIEARRQADVGPIEIVWELDADSRSSVLGHGDGASPWIFLVEVFDFEGLALLHEGRSDKPFYIFSLADQQAAFGYALGETVTLSVRLYEEEAAPSEAPETLRLPITRDYPLVVALAGQINAAAYAMEASRSEPLGLARERLRQSLALGLQRPIFDIGLVDLAVAVHLNDQPHNGRDSGAIGSYLAALTHFAVLSGESPVGQPAAPIYEQFDNEKDTALIRALQELAKWPRLDAVIWASGENSLIGEALARRYPGEAAPNSERWRSAVEAIWRELRAASAPDLPIVVQGVGRLWYRGHEVHQAVRDRYAGVQLALIEADERAFLGADLTAFGRDFYRAEAESAIAYVPESYHALADRLATALAPILEGQPPPDRAGPDYVAQPLAVEARRRGGIDRARDEDILITWESGTAGLPAESYTVRLLDPSSHAVKAAGETPRQNLVLTEQAQRALFGSTLSSVFLTVTGSADGVMDSPAAIGIVPIHE